MRGRSRHRGEGLAAATIIACAVTCNVGGFARPAAAQVLTAQYDNARTGATLSETVLTPHSVGGPDFGRVAVLPVDGDVYAQPLYVPDVSVPGKGRHDLLIVATERNSVYAFDARTRSPEPLWHTTLNGGDGAGPVPFLDVRCPFIRPDVGITPTPVVDAAHGTLLVLARTKVPAGGEDHYVQRLHALDVRSGRDRRPPTAIRASVPGTGAGSAGGRVDFDPLRENPRAALLLSHGVVYASWASSCDVRPYHGWVMAYDAVTLRQLAVWNSSPDGAEGGIWQGDAGLAADSAGDVYVATGNGTFDESDAHRRNYGSSVVRLSLADSVLVVRDFFTPFNVQALNREDADLGSSGPLLLPGDAAHPKLLALTGKDGTTYVVDADRMGGFHREGDTGALQKLPTSSGGFGASAYWNHTLYVWGSFDVLRAYRVAGDTLALSQVGPTKATDPGANPTVSANGTADGIVWAVESKPWSGSDRPAVLHAYDARDIRREIFSSESDVARDRAGVATRFTLVTVAGGAVYVGVKGAVDVYGLRGR